MPDIKYKFYEETESYITIPPRPYPLCHVSYIKLGHLTIFWFVRQRACTPKSLLFNTLLTTPIVVSGNRAEMAGTRSEWNSMGPEIVLEINLARV